MQFVIATILLVKIIVGDCTSYDKPAWEGTSQETELSQVVVNTQTNVMWATLRSPHPSGKGQKIASFDPQSASWHIDNSQPHGADRISLNSKGLPAFV